MIINKDDTGAKYFHGITIFDERGQPLNFVNELDTETLLCKVGPLGKVVVAAGFVVIPQPRIYDYLPEGLFPFVIPVKNPKPDQIHAFMLKLLEQRGAFKASAFTYDDMKQEENTEETFNWPRDAFVGLAKTVIPSDEQEAKSEAAFEERKWESGFVVYDKSFGIAAEAQLPWEGLPTTSLKGHKFSSLWFKTTDGELTQWGVAVKPPAEFAIPNTVLRLGAFTKPKTVFKDADKLHQEQLFAKTWKVLSIRGQENGTIELMMVENKEEK
jgi:hypothetical protein